MVSGHIMPWDIGEVGIGTYDIIDIGDMKKMLTSKHQTGAPPCRPFHHGQGQGKANFYIFDQESKKWVSFPQTF